MPRMACWMTPGAAGCCVGTGAAAGGGCAAAGAAGAGRPPSKSDCAARIRSSSIPPSCAARSSGFPRPALLDLAGDQRDPGAGLLAAHPDVVGAAGGIDVERAGLVGGARDVGVAELAA